MNSNTLYERNEKWFTTARWISSGCALVYLIAILFLPIASANPTKIDSLKITFTLFDLCEEHISLSIGFVIMTLSLLSDTVVMKHIKNDNWEKKLGLLFFVSICGLLLFVIGMMVFDVGSIEYQVTKSISLYLEPEIGSYLLWFGLVPSATTFTKVYCLKKIKNGESESKVFWGKDEKPTPNDNV